jgi:hypothetical protein
MILAAALVALFVVGASRHAPVSKQAFAVPYNNRVLDDPLEILIVQSDGQAFATLARDPSLARAPEQFGTEEEAAYRAQRPLVPWLAWAVSLGRPGWVPPAFAGICVASTGAAAAALGALFGRRRRWLGLAVLLLPGVISALSYFGPEPLVLALLLGGLLAWKAERPVLAAGLFAAAALGRETALVVPLALGAWELRHRRFRAAVVVTVGPLVVAATWWTALIGRVGAAPWDARHDRLVWPFTGLWEVISGGWDVDPTLGPAYALLAAALTVAVIVREPHHAFTAIVAAHALMASVFGRRVWADSEFFTRPLLPLYAIALVVLLSAGEGSPASARGSPAPP